MLEKMLRPKSGLLLNVYVSAVIFVMGAWLENWFSVIGQGDQIFTIALVLFLLFVLIFQYYWRNVQKDTSDIASALMKIHNEVNQHANLVRYEDGYKVLSTWVKNAKTEILILTFADSDNRWSVKYSSRGKSKARQQWFDALIELVEAGEVTCKRILQMNYDRNTRGLELSDNRLEKAYKYLTDEKQNLRLTLALCKAKKAKLYVSRTYFQHSIVLVDGKNLFMNFDHLDPKTGQVECPFVLIVENKTEEYFKPLVELYEEIIDRSLSVAEPDLFEHRKQTWWNKFIKR